MYWHDLPELCRQLRSQNPEVQRLIVNRDAGARVYLGLESPPRGSRTAYDKRQSSSPEPIDMAIAAIALDKPEESLHMLNTFRQSLERPAGPQFAARFKEPLLYLLHHVHQTAQPQKINETIMNVVCANVGKLDGNDRKDVEKATEDALLRMSAAHAPGRRNTGRARIANVPLSIPPRQIGRRVRAADQRQFSAERTRPDMRGDAISSAGNRAFPGTGGVGEPTSGRLRKPRPAVGNKPGMPGKTASPKTGLPFQGWDANLRKECWTTATALGMPNARTRVIQQHYDNLKAHYLHVEKKFQQLRSGQWDREMRNACWDAASQKAWPETDKQTIQKHFDAFKRSLLSLQLGASWDKIMTEACWLAAKEAYVREIPPGNGSYPIVRGHSATGISHNTPLPASSLRTDMPRQKMLYGPLAGKFIRTFWDKYDALSNYAHTPFTMQLKGADSFTYQFGEQAFQEAKVRFVRDQFAPGDYRIAECDQLIMDIRSASDADKTRDLAKKVQETRFAFDGKAWGRKKQDVMKDILKRKVAQNSNVRTILMSTSDEDILVEASPYDTSWGVGLGANDLRILDSRNWGYKDNRYDHNHNLLGRFWMEIRSELRNSQGQRA